MNTVTHPYGTTRKATVVKSNAIVERPTIPASVLLLTDEFGEGHILVAGCGDMTSKVGDKGVLTFTQGGPMGGYWRFTKDV